MAHPGLEADHLALIEVRLARSSSAISDDSLCCTRADPSERTQPRRFLVRRPTPAAVFSNGFLVWRLPSSVRTDEAVALAARRHALRRLLRVLRRVADPFFVHPSSVAGIWTPTSGRASFVLVVLGAPADDAGVGRAAALPEVVGHARTQALRRSEDQEPSVRFFEALAGPPAPPDISARFFSSHHSSIESRTTLRMPYRIRIMKRPAKTGAGTHSLSSTTPSLSAATAARTKPQRPRCTPSGPRRAARAGGQRAKER